ncbi:hypothetical protein QBC34DRAFT_136888 [Podospora aff. communis PSN243]|uniref:Uncharacterized protein n=1 Tax=Podospora aff. communis PSN243 TaxID=3040156 RepID=A0AAV9H0M3_9PEZI|nr:hypothetical protein QBC34DRAFT_136888 [Podospora aff. communis PSN243]
MAVPASRQGAAGRSRFATVGAFFASRYWSTTPRLKLARGPGIRSRGQKVERLAATSAESGIKQCQCGLFRSCIAQQRRPRSSLPSGLQPARSTGSRTAKERRNSSNNPATFGKTASPLKRRSLAAKIVRFGIQRGAEVCVPGKPQPRYFPPSARVSGKSATTRARRQRVQFSFVGRISGWLWTLVQSGIWEYHTSPPRSLHHY